MMASVIIISWSDNPGMFVDDFIGVALVVNIISNKLSSLVGVSCTWVRLNSIDMSINFCCTSFSGAFGLMVILLQSMSGQLKSPASIVCFGFPLFNIVIDSESLFGSLMLRWGI